MKLIRDLEKKAKLLRLEGSNSMALLLQNAADKIGELDSELQYVDAKVKSASNCHPLAVSTLLNEAVNRTHWSKP